MKRHVKLFEEFLLELDLDLGGAGGEEKPKEKPIDPDVEIAKERKKKREKAQRARNEEIESALMVIDAQMGKTPQEFQDAFSKRIKETVEEDDRVKIHDLILDIQRFQIPLAKSKEEDKVESISPVLSALQDLNDREYL